MKIFLWWTVRGEYLFFHRDDLQFFFFLCFLPSFSSPKLLSDWKNMRNCGFGTYSKIITFTQNWQNNYHVILFSPINTILLTLFVPESSYLFLILNFSPREVHSEDLQTSPNISYHNFCQKGRQNGLKIGWIWVKSQTIRGKIQCYQNYLC